MKKSIVVAPHIYLPRKGVDMHLYSVIACDQFTSQKEYWDELKEMIGDKVSTFHMIYPEAYLENTNEEEYINNINNNISNYLKNNDLVDIGESFILVERITDYGIRRLGLVISIDLEEYSYKRGVPCSIKASEATIVERIPPRLKIRKDASVELPHTLLLFDDINKIIVEPLYQNRESLPLIYDFDLNQKGGHIRGYQIKDTKKVIDLFDELYQRNNNGLMFIVGDGNHSLATAKTHWENIKKNLSEEEQKNHPARYALVEVNNIYDDGIIFEPIHRLLFNVDDDFLIGLNEVCKGPSKIAFFSKNSGKNPLNCPKNAADTYKMVQEYIDSYLLNHSQCKIDFIHDESSLIALAKKYDNSVAIIMPAIGKGDNCNTIIIFFSECNK